MRDIDKKEQSGTAGALEELKSRIDYDNVPRHVAIIMDGNGRWAKSRKLVRVKGHAKGARIVRTLTETAARTGVKYLTLYCFSTENWKRPVEEVSFLMDLIHSFLLEQAEDMVRLGVKLSVIGDRTPLPDNVNRELDRVMTLTENCDVINLVLALNYGSRDEILRGARKLASDAAEGKINPMEIDEEAFSSSLYTVDIPDPDLMIRTSGELRLSNFLLWQLAYAEFYFTDVNWPDFDDAEFYKAIISYQQRHRRFGDIK